jgi:hypothetical protein
MVSFLVSPLFFKINGLVSPLTLRFRRDRRQVSGFWVLGSGFWVQGFGFIVKIGKRLKVKGKRIKVNR